ncbi:MAG: hypothetical protein KDD38_06685 [Bdellovibrionales bacterium]|nr:hypothetical protein [Bdellovibrionales bacterium]
MKNSAIFFISATSVLSIFLYNKYPSSVTPHSPPNNLITVYQDIVDNEPDYYISDPIVGMVHKPHAMREYDWPEHPNKKFQSKTNNLGFREDHDTEITKPTDVFRVLVTGDSHIDGVINNKESFPNQLEFIMNSSSGKKNEIINAGAGYYSPRAYEAVIRKYSTLSPNLFIAVIYTGNDFLDTTHFLEMSEPVARPPDYYERLEKAYALNSALVGQTLNQFFYFKNFPDMREKVINSIVESMANAAAQCTKIKSEFIVVMLPTKLDAGQHNLDKITAAIAALELDQSDFESNRQMSREICDQLHAQNIKCWNSQEALNDSKQEYFWEQDYHLNILGHKTLANGFFKKYKSNLQKPSSE